MAGLLGDIASIANPVLGALGTQSAGGQQRQYLNAAMGQLQTGYGDANSLLQPIQGTANNAYQTLAGNTQGGQYSMPQQSAFQMPSNWQTDPGYQFALSQGQDAIKNQQAQGGMAHSPQTARALDQYSTGMANQEYGDVYNRLNNANNMAFNQNTQSKQNAFSNQNTLTNPLLSSTLNMGQNDIGLGQGLGSIEEQKGNVSAALAQNPYTAGMGSLSAMGGAGGQQGLLSQIMSMFGGGGMTSDAGAAQVPGYANMLAAMGTP